MKKLMIAATIVCAAIASQAALVNWSSTTAPYFLDTSALSGNGGYAVGTTTMKNSGYTFAYVLTVTGVNEASGTVAFNFFTGAFATTAINIDGSIAAGTAYNYTIAITTSLSDVGKQGEWDYSSAVATATLSGTFTGATGSSAIISGVPSTWTVTGAVKEEPEPTPEPTSGLLMLLGMAGLALRRKQK